MMYWMVIGNHALMIQSRSLTSKHLEEYLTWLLKDRTTTITPTGQVMLQAKFDASDVGGDLNDIKEIVVGGKTGIHAAAATPAPITTTTESYKEVATRKPWSLRALEVLRAVMANEADLQKLLKAIPKGADLQVSVHIGYKAKRDVTRAPMQQALRNLPEGEITARGPGGRMTGKDIRLSHQVSVIKKGSLLDPKDVIRALREAHQYFVDNGKIDG